MNNNGVIQVNTPLTVKQLVSGLDYPCNLVGDAGKEIMNVASPLNASENTMVFLKGAKKSITTKQDLNTITGAGVVIVDNRISYKDLDSYRLH